MWNGNSNSSGVTGWGLLFSFPFEVSSIKHCMTWQFRGSVLKLDSWIYIKKIEKQERKMQISKSVLALVSFCYNLRGNDIHTNFYSFVLSFWSSRKCTASIEISLIKCTYRWSVNLLINHCVPLFLFHHKKKLSDKIQSHKAVHKNICVATFTTLMPAW